MSAVDMNAWARQKPSGDGPQVELPYVLVADTHVERAAMCLDAIRQFKAGVLVARDGEEATRILERFGPPILLIIDLSLSRRDGFAVIEGLRAHRWARTEIIAWAAFRELSEFAAQRLSGLNVRVLRGAAPADVVQAAIERAFERHSSATAPIDVSVSPSAEELHDMMTALGEKARHLSRTPGVAVYLRAPGSSQFRAAVTWTSDAPIPHSPYYMPRVFGWILETGEALVLPDLATQPLTDTPASLQDAVRGLVAVPIIGSSQQIIGTICVFDLKPLVLTDLDVEALKTLGRSVTFGGQPARVEKREPAPEPAYEPVPAPAAPPPAPPSAPRDLSQMRIEAAPAPSEPDRRADPEWPTPLLDRLNGEFAAARELARARREERQVSVVLFAVSIPNDADVSRRPPADDPAGLVAGTLVKTIRQSDLPIRWSGDEVLVLLPGLPLDEARRVAERVRAALQAGSGHRAAVSAGVAELLTAETFGALVTRARDRVRLALEHGHNRVA